MDEDAILLAKARRHYGLYPRCSHRHVTLCQHTDPEFGWFVAYQCDDCGIVTQDYVSAEQLEGAGDLPFIDLALWEQAVSAIGGDTLMGALHFMAKALRP